MGVGRIKREELGFRGIGRETWKTKRRESKGKRRRIPSSFNPLLFIHPPCSHTVGCRKLSLTNGKA